MFSPPPPPPPPPKTHTYNLGYVFVQFDQFWREKQPKNVMAFQEVKEEFEANLTQRLSETPIRISMRI